MNLIVYTTQHKYIFGLENVSRVMGQNSLAP